MDKSGSSFQYAVVGVVLGLFAPFGWWIVSAFLPQATLLQSVYVYMALVSCASFAMFGYFLGQFADHMKTMADLDPLTQLMNYGSFRNMVERFLLLAVRDGHDFCIMMLDIDNFKDINDQYDHLMGNGLIKHVTEVFHDCTRRSDAICRHSADKFLICLPKVTLTGAEQVAEKIRSSVEAKTFEINGQDIKTTVSIGIAMLSQKTSVTLDDLIEAAETGMIRAKEAGRNCVTPAEQEDFPLAQAF